MVVSLLMVLTGCGQKKEANEEMAGMKNPVVSVESAKEFETLKLRLEAPEGAEDVSYSIIDGKTAQIQFTLDDGEYTYRSARTESDIAGVYEERVGEPVTEIVEVSKAKTEVKTQNTASGYKTALWFWGEAQYSLFCRTASVEDQVFLDLAKKLAAVDYQAEN